MAAPVIADCLRKFRRDIAENARSDDPASESWQYSVDSSVIFLSFTRHPKIVMTGFAAPRVGLAQRSQHRQPELLWIMLSAPDRHHPAQLAAPTSRGQDTTPSAQGQAAPPEPTADPTTYATFQIIAPGQATLPVRRLLTFCLPLVHGPWLSSALI
jgi:hypothetical protein